MRNVKSFLLVALSILQFAQAEYGGNAEYAGPAETEFAQQQVVVAGAGYDPCLDPSKVQTVAIDTAAAASAVTRVAISGSMRIFFCGGSIQGSAAGTITVRFGTGTNCATSPTNIAIVKIVTDGDGKAFNSPGTYLRSATGQALCDVTSASLARVGEYRYVQENVP